MEKENDPAPTTGSNTDQDLNASSIPQQCVSDTNEQTQLVSLVRHLLAREVGTLKAWVIADLYNTVFLGLGAVELWHLFRFAILLGPRIQGGGGDFYASNRNA